MRRCCCGCRHRRRRRRCRCRRCRCCCYRCRHHMPPCQLRHNCLCSSSGSSGGSSSGLRRCAVAAAAHNRMHRLHLFCVCLLSECLLHVAQNTMSRVLPSRIPAGILDSIGFRNKLILPWNDLIPTSVPQNSADSAEKSGFRKMGPGRNRNTKRNAHPSCRRPFCHPGTHLCVFLPIIKGRRTKCGHLEDRTFLVVSLILSL
jgi:hypothetical protein